MFFLFRFRKFLIFILFVAIVFIFLKKDKIFLFFSENLTATIVFSIANDEKKQSKRENIDKEMNKIFDVEFDSKPKNAFYELTLSDGKVLRGKTPFIGKLSWGNLKIKIWLKGYNIFEKNLLVDRNIAELYYLDKEGQLLRHLFDVELSSPKAVAFHPNGREIWAVSLLNKKYGVRIFDAFSGRKIKDINLDNGGGTEIVFSLDGKKVYVSQMETAKIFEIDSEEKKILRIFKTGSSWTKFMVLSFSQDKLFASNWSASDVSEINLQTGKLVRKIPTVNTPRGLYLTKNGDILYIAGFDRGEIEKIDLKTGKGEIIFRSGGAMRHVVGDENRGVLYFSDMGKNVIWKVFLKNNKVEKFIDTDHNPNTIALSSDGKILFVSCRGMNASADNYYIPGPEWGSVLLVDTASGKILDAIIGGNQPTGLAVSADGRLLVFSNFLDGNLEIFAIPSYEILKAGEGGRSKVYKSELKK